MQIAGLDDMDNRIIDLLLKDGRASYSEIGAAVGLSRTAVKSRIRALEASGIIRGYQAILDPQASTGGMTFVVNIETEAAQFAAIKDAMAASPERMPYTADSGQARPRYHSETGHSRRKDREDFSAAHHFHSAADMLY